MGKHPIDDEMDEDQREARKVLWLALLGQLLWSAIVIALYHLFRGN